MVRPPVPLRQAPSPAALPAARSAHARSRSSDRSEPSDITLPGNPTAAQWEIRQAAEARRWELESLLEEHYREQPGGWNPHGRHAEVLLLARAKAVREAREQVPPEERRDWNLPAALEWGDAAPVAPPPGAGAGAGAQRKAQRPPAPVPKPQKAPAGEQAKKPKPAPAAPAAAPVVLPRLKFNFGAAKAAAQAMAQQGAGAGAGAQAPAAAAAAQASPPPPAAAAPAAPAAAPVVLPKLKFSIGLKKPPAAAPPPPPPGGA